MKSAGVRNLALLVGVVCTLFLCGCKKRADDLAFLSRFTYTKTVDKGPDPDVVTYRISGNHAAIVAAVPGAASTTPEIDPVDPRKPHGATAALYQITINGHASTLLVPSKPTLRCALMVQLKG